MKISNKTTDTYEILHWRPKQTSQCVCKIFLNFIPWLLFQDFSFGGGTLFVCTLYCYKYNSCYYYYCNRYLWPLSRRDLVRSLVWVESRGRYRHQSPRDKGLDVARPAGCGCTGTTRPAAATGWAQPDALSAAPCPPQPSRNEPVCPVTSRGVMAAGRWYSGTTPTAYPTADPGHRTPTRPARGRQDRHRYGAASRLQRHRERT